MLTINWLNSFRRDYRRETKGRFGGDLDAMLGDVVDDLANGRTLAPRLRDHGLSGEWLGHRDCHLKPDLVLIYRVDEDAVHLVRLGSHSELGL